MAQQKKTDGRIQAGTEILPPEPGKVFPWLAQRVGLTQLVTAATSWLNLSVIVKMIMSDGTVQVMPTVRPTITSKKSILTLAVDLSNVSSGGSGSVPFSGVGAPAAGTLSNAFAYVTSPTPSLYVDMTPGAQKLYVCTTAGTNASSVWAPTSAGGGIPDYDGTLAWTKNSVVYVPVGAVAGTPGVTFRALADVPAHGETPVFPNPGPSWMALIFPALSDTVCKAGAQHTVVINAIQTP